MMMRDVLLAGATMLLAMACARADEVTDLPDVDAVLREPCPDGARWVIEEGAMVACMDADDRPHGPQLSYYESGVRWTYAEYRHGELQGWVVQWHEAGPLKSAGRQRGETPVGHWRWWSEDGSLRREASFAKQ